jgi:uncharacterized protein YbjT (DUF2867 family)
MKVMIFGATGMVGQGVLRECLLDPDVERVLTIGRAPTGQQNEKLREIVHADLFDLSAIEGELAGWDACFFCLGVSAAGMSEADYTRVTYDLTLSVARTLAKLSPQMCFVYVSGAGTGGSAMWARVKGKTEAALLELRFRAKYMFRPGFIQPQHGIKSKTKLYRAIYAVMGPLYPALRAVAPKYVTTSEQVGRAMLVVAKRGARSPIVENADINTLATSEANARA